MQKLILFICVFSLAQAQPNSLHFALDNQFYLYHKDEALMFLNTLQKTVANSNKVINDFLTTKNIIPLLRHNQNINKLSSEAARLSSYFNYCKLSANAAIGYWEYTLQESSTHFDISRMDYKYQILFMNEETKKAKENYTQDVKHSLDKARADYEWLISYCLDSITTPPDPKNYESQTFN